jgi:alkylation response protein AidB-like acyl-CoA dehydrogenase
MDFELRGDARELVTLTADLAASGRSLWPALAEAGVFAAAFEGYGQTTQAAILTTLGRHASPIPYLTSIVAAGSTLDRCGAKEWAGRAAQGAVIAVGVNGQIHGIEPAPDAVLVPTEHGLHLLDAADVKIEPQHVEGGPGTGLLRSPLPAQPLITDPSAAEWLRAYLTVGAAAYQLGVVERACEMTAEYARARVQFGRPIGAFQAVSQRLADAYIDVEALRVAVAQAAWLLDDNDRATATAAPDLAPPTPDPAPPTTSAPLAPATIAAVATAGFWAAEAGHRVLHTAVHVHGGVGIDMDYPLHRYFLAAKYHEFLLGGATAQLLTLSEVLT